MSTTAYYEPVRPEAPLGSWSQLKWLLFDEGDRLKGRERVIERGDRMHTYLRGYHDGLPADDERRAELEEFIAALEKHGQLRVWIDE